MKQIRVTSPFFDITLQNQRREVGDTFLATEERAAYLVNGQLCEYVIDDDEKPKGSTQNTETPAEGEKKETKSKTTKGSKK